MATFSVTTNKVDDRSVPLIHASRTLKVNPNGRTLFYSNYTHISKELNIKHLELLPSYIDNLCRLGILEIPSDTYLVKEGIYDALENDLIWNGFREILEKTESEIIFDRGFMRLTSFGKHFIKSVVKDKTSE